MRTITLQERRARLGTRHHLARPTDSAVTVASDMVGAVEVDTETGPAYLLADDLDPVPPPAPWVALLPPWTRPRWVGRAGVGIWGNMAPRFLDRNGNAGATIWWEGRIVGGWSQRPGGEVVYGLLEDVGSDATAAVEHEIGTRAWLGGTTVTARFGRRSTSCWQAPRQIRS